MTDEEREIQALTLTRKIAAFTFYGDGLDELGDSEDAALVLNALITEARAIVDDPTIDLIPFSEGRPMTEYQLRLAAKVYLAETPPPRSRKGTIAWDALRRAIVESEAAAIKPQRNFLP